MSGILKFLLFLLIASGIAVGCLLFLGGKKLEYSTAISIDATPEQVFPYLVKPEPVIRWMENVEKIQPLSESPTAIGSTFAVTFRVNEGTKVYTQEVIRFQPSEIFTVRIKDSTITRSSIFTLQSVAGKTALRYQVKTMTKGMGRLFVPFQNADLRQAEMVADTLALKKLVETDLAAKADRTPLQVDSVDDASVNDSQVDETVMENQ